VAYFDHHNHDAGRLRLSIFAQPIALHDMSQSPQPTSVTSRITLIDSLRGFAIFGILMVNLPLMYQPMTNVLMNYSFALQPIDAFAEWTVKIFFEGKFYVLFSALFGYGFYLFLHKASGTQAQNLKLFRRRLGYLLLIGIAHVGLLWAGDILIIYALFGFVLIAFRKKSDRTKFKWALALVLLPIVLSASAYGLMLAASQLPEAKASMEASMAQGNTQTLDLFNRAAETYKNGSYLETIHMRWQEYAALLPGLLFFYPTVLAMFLLGFIAAQRELISQCTAHLPFWRKATTWGFTLGLPLSIAYAYAMHRVPAGEQASGWLVATTFLHITGGILLCLGYVALMVTRYAHGKSSLFDRWFAPVGRMALTNYIGHSFISVWLFHSYGLGLFGKIVPAMGIAIALGIFALQVPFSIWWLKHWRFGPLEWLWRSLTYGQIQNMRRLQPS